MKYYIVVTEVLNQEEERIDVEEYQTLEEIQKRVKDIKKYNLRSIECIFKGEMITLEDIPRPK